MKKEKKDKVKADKKPKVKKDKVKKPLKDRLPKLPKLPKISTKKMVESLSVLLASKANKPEIKVVGFIGDYSDAKDLWDGLNKAFPHYTEAFGIHTPDGKYMVAVPETENSIGEVLPVGKTIPAGCYFVGKLKTRPTEKFALQCYIEYYFNKKDKPMAEFWVLIN